MEPIHYLARRENWQLAANQGGACAENDVSSCIKSYLDATQPGEWLVESHPKDLSQIYLEYDHEQNPTAYQRPAEPVKGDIWYDAEKKYFLKETGGKNPTKVRMGCEPDCKIQHIASGRRCFIECKNQKAAGNAHERAAKFATGSVISFVQKKFGIEYNPFGYLFTGGMVEDITYRLELQLLFGFASNRLFMWRKGRDAKALVEWLESAILPSLRAT
jgi:hypothetical protein